MSYEPDDPRQLDEALPPCDLNAERAVIGACVAAPQAIDECVEVVAAADFYRPAHGDLYAAMVAMRDEGRQIDALTLADYLGDRLVKLGGAPYLLDCMAGVPVATNVTRHAEIVAAKAVLRRLAEAATRIHQLARHGTSGGVEVSEVVERARATLDTIAADARGDSETVTLDELVDEALKRYASPRPPALATGWADLDEWLSGGLRPGTLTVIGARPSVGKTVVGTNLAVSVAAHGGGVIFFSLEMPRAELSDRIIAGVARVPLRRLTTHDLSEGEWERVRQAQTKVRGWPLQINDHPHLSLTTMRSLARDRVRSPRGLALVVVDYLGLIRPADTRIPRQEQVAGFSRGLKLLAKELHVPVVALAQVNREAEKTETKRPRMHQLRESGAIEADADVVLLLHRDADPARTGELDVFIDKNRHGGTGCVTLAWQPHFATARSLMEAV